MTTNIKVGDVVVSKLGHDVNKKYIVFEVLNDRFIMVINGTIRAVDKPKTKNIKHVKVIGWSEDFVQSINNNNISNLEIAKILKKFE